MLIEASKGGHTAVALLLMETPLHIGLMESPLNTSFNTPVGSPNGTTASPIHPSHQQQQQQQQRMAQFHDCSHECQHLPPVQDYFGHTCNLGASCDLISPPPSVVQPNSLASHPFVGMPSSFTGQSLMGGDVTSAAAAPGSEFIVPNLPISLPSSTLPLANLTQADLQSLAQALSFSASVNSITNADGVVSTSATVAENLGIGATVNFPVIDPNVARMLPAADLPMGLPQISPTNSIVTSAARTVTSTGVQTEDAISMIHRLTDSVQQLSALQNFAASHNLELVNLTIPPSPFPANVGQEEGIMVAEPARPLHDTLAHMTREGQLIFIHKC